MWVAWDLADTDDDDVENTSLWKRPGIPERRRWVGNKDKTRDYHPRSGEFRALLSYDNEKGSL